MVLSTQRTLRLWVSDISCQCSNQESQTSGKKSRTIVCPSWERATYLKCYKLIFIISSLQERERVGVFYHESLKLHYRVDVHFELVFVVRPMYGQIDVMCEWTDSDKYNHNCYIARLFIDVPFSYRMLMSYLNKFI